jgi:hypothetical protein
MWLGCCQTIKKSEEKGVNRALNPKRRMKNVGDGNCKTTS